MSSPFSICESSAMPYEMKRSSLSQELLRRMMNMDKLTTQQEMDKTINEFSRKLIKSGFNLSQVREILVSGLKGYENKLTREKIFNEPMHKNQSEAKTYHERKITKMVEKCSWNKKRKRDDDKDDKENDYSKRKRFMSKDMRKEVNELVKGVIFVPRTKDGMLAKMLREEESSISRNSQTKFKIVEECGYSLKSLLHRANPWGGKD